MGYRAMQIIHMTPQMRRDFAQALHMLGRGSQSSWLHVQVRRIIREAKIQFGEDFATECLREEERFICEVIEDGAAELGEIAKEAGITLVHARRVIKRLLLFGWIEERRKGGKTEVARGAATKLYFLKRPLPTVRDEE